MFKQLPHVLVVDDDDRLRELLRKFLSANGFYVTLAADTAEARHLLAQFVMDAVILDVMMPGETGLEFMEWLNRHDALPVLMLSAMGTAEDRIAGLEQGVCDYLPKPFEPVELLLRLENMLKRPAPQGRIDRILSFGPYQFTPDTGRLEKNGEPVYLTNGEQAMLTLLTSREGQAMSREELYEQLQPGTNIRSIDVQITRLRRKIESNPRQPQYLRTIRGEGYAFFAA
jgi:two-component system phosphate regulon response regulator OmpR